ncbi:hypothetical protein BDV12DRAFT_182478 [Aspergillus spectabilis]
MGLPDETATKTERLDAGDNVPTYTQSIDTDTDQVPTLPAINLAQNAGPAEYTTVTHYECIAHLKFLAALSDLRETVTSTPDLFNLPDPTPREFGSHINEAWALVKEKRWAVYTAKAVARYTAWWNACVPASRPRPSIHNFSSAVYEDITVCKNPLAWTRDELPPLDVLMVWHAHMLNPRSFLEDCLRHGKISFWAAGFPWQAINACIDDQTLIYDAGREAATVFTSKTNLSWDNLEDMPSKIIPCPKCGHANSAPWTQGKLALPLDLAFVSWRGFTDKYFGLTCAQCCIGITHETLRIQKFKTDVTDLLDGHIPMPGTLFNTRGVPEQLSKTRRREQQQDFPNRLLRAARRDLREYLRSNNLWFCPSVTMLRDYLQILMKDRETMRTAMNSSISSLYPDEKIAFRRMMSRYWDNSSPFALDLVGAVIRQGTFITKMDNIDWLHSPALTETILRLIRKYAVFFQIMSTNPGRMAVPTLDVDLAWHTHQLSPSRYFTYSLYRTKQDGKRAILIDHDDKVSEVKLSDGFEWTAKIYRKLTDGGVYSECTCWYCEATRSSDLGPSLLPSSSASRARQTADALHTNLSVSHDPNKNAHISAHSAVKTKPDATAIAAGTDHNHLKFLKLRSEYTKARRRAEKRSFSNSNYNSLFTPNGTETKKKEHEKEDDRNADVYTHYPLMWGYPVYVPYYGPYTTDPGVHCEAYAADPACMSLAAGHPGNCAAGTCGVVAGVREGVVQGVEDLDELIKC